MKNVPIMMMDGILSGLKKLMRVYQDCFAKIPSVRRVVSPFLKVLGSIILHISGLRLPPDFSFWSKMQVVFRLNERETLALIRKVVKPGMCVFDIGANIGYYARLFAKLVGTKGRVYAFEPTPESLTFLRYNTTHYDNIECYGVAVADHDGSSPFYLHPLSCASNSLYDLAGSSDCISVPVLALDTFVKEHHITHVDMIKIDVEGGEPAVLRGMSDLIASQTKLLLILEYCPDHLERAGVEAETFLSEIRRSGFLIYTIVADGGLSEYNGAEISRKHETIEVPVVNLLCTKGYSLTELASVTPSKCFIS